MTVFLLMRHGEPDFSGPRKWNTPGWGAEMATLTDQGKQQVRQRIREITEFDPQIVLVSPTSRTLHSLLVLQEAIHLPYNVEFDLHEWVPDKEFRWRTLGEVQQIQSEYERFQGCWPEGQTRQWETSKEVNQRALGVFVSYLHFKRVLVICHGMLIKALTGTKNVEPAGLVKFEWENRAA